MSLKEKREARRARENEILKQMAEENAVREDGGAVEDAVEEVREAEAAAQEVTADSAAEAGATGDATATSAKKPADNAAGPSYTPMTDEQIKKVRLILWPILFVIAILVYFLTRSCKG